MSAPVQQQPVYDVHQGNQQMAVAPGAPTNHATTTTAAGAGAAHPGQHDDVQDWMTRLQGALNNPETVTAPTSAGAQPWHTEFFSCFSPIDICQSLRVRMGSLVAC